MNLNWSIQLFIVKIYKFLGKTLPPEHGREYLIFAVMRTALTLLAEYNYRDDWKKLN